MGGSGKGKTKRTGSPGEEKRGAKTPRGRTTVRNVGENAHLPGVGGRCKQRRGEWCGSCMGKKLPDQGQNWVTILVRKKRKRAKKKRPKKNGGEYCEEGGGTRGSELGLETKQIKGSIS